MPQQNFKMIWTKKYGSEKEFNYTSLNISYVVYVTIEKDGFLILLSNGEKLLAMLDDISLSALPVYEGIICVTPEWQQKNLNWKPSK